VRVRSLRFSGVLGSEWIKLRSLRSSWWSFGIVLVLQVAFGVIFAIAVSATTIGVIIGQLVVSIQGVLLMAGEFSTGQSLSSFLAVPTRLPALWAKALVFGAVTLVTALTSSVLTFVIVAPILRDAGYLVDASSGELCLRLGGAGVYLLLICVIALGIGAVTRVPFAGIGITLGASLAIPSLLPLFGGTWAGDIISWLPGLAGQQLFF
jgi:ABC-2 type transport system permease protein